LMPVQYADIESIKIKPERKQGFVIEKYIRCK